MLEADRPLSEVELKLQDHTLEHMKSVFPQMDAIEIICADSSRTLTFRAGKSQGQRIPASCIAKLFTGELVLQLIRASRLSEDNEVAGVLEIESEAVRQAFAGITLAHLLDHSHGLDDTALLGLPTRADKLIDTDSLCRHLARAPRLFEPGASCSYGNAGAYLAGAVLERLHAMPYRSVLEERLLGPLGIELTLADTEVTHDEAPALCPSTGGRWLLSASEVTRFLREHLIRLWPPAGSNRDRVVAKTANTQMLPGWHPAEKATHLGWRQYRTHWFGHDGQALNSSLLARIDIERGVSVVMSCKHLSGSDPAYAIFSRLFRDVFPELVAIDSPRPLSDGDAKLPELAAFTGLYCTRGSEVFVGEDCETLFIRVAFPRLFGAPPFSPEKVFRLRAARDNLFLTVPTERALFPYLQFIDADAEGQYRYLWNGRNVWRRRR